MHLWKWLVNLALPNLFPCDSSKPPACPILHANQAPLQSALYLHTSGGFRYELGFPFSLVLPWASPPSAERAAALLLLASEAWVGVSSRLRTPLSTGANERRAIDMVCPNRHEKQSRQKGKEIRGWGINKGGRWEEWHQCELKCKNQHKNQREKWLWFKHKRWTPDAIKVRLSMLERQKEY